MGTHPIFESDFDCLTECESMGRESTGSYYRYNRSTRKDYDQLNSGSNGRHCADSLPKGNPFMKSSSVSDEITDFDAMSMHPTNPRLGKGRDTEKFYNYTDPIPPIKRVGDKFFTKNEWRKKKMEAEKMQMLKQRTKVTKKSVNKESQISSRSQKRESRKQNSLKRQIEKVLYPPRPTRKHLLNETKNKKKQNKI